jgi:hypothetical protein
MSSAPDLDFIMTAMTDYLSTEQLKVVLLKAIPQREMRTFQPPTPPGRPGLRVQPRAPAAMTAEILDPAYSDLFVADTDALQYLEEIRSVVLAENPERDARILKFVLEEYDDYFAKETASVPDFFRPVLILFKKWHERCGNPEGTVDEMCVCAIQEFDKNNSMAWWERWHKDRHAFSQNASMVEMLHELRECVGDNIDIPYKIMDGCEKG